MIKLSNGHELKYMTASGAMGFDGKGWFWEKPLIAAGLIDLSLFTVVLRTLTLKPRLYPICNHSWIRPWTWLPFSPWSCTRTIRGGIINKVGLYNPGIDWWCSEVGPKIEDSSCVLIGSVFGTKDECSEMSARMSLYNLVAIEVNASCPNTGHAREKAVSVIECVHGVKSSTHLPVIVKVSVDQDYELISKELYGVAEAISLNSVPYKIAFPDGRKSPLEKIGQPNSGGGGVSGRAAQEANWEAVRRLGHLNRLPVIAPSVMKYDDIDQVRRWGAKAISFGAIHLPSHPVWLKPWTLFTNPCKPTRFVRRGQKELAHSRYNEYLEEVHGDAI